MVEQKRMVLEKSTNTPVKTDRAAPASGILSSAAGRLLLAAGVIQFALIVASLFGNGSLTDSLNLPQPSRRAVPASNSHEPYFRGNLGPWGDLEFVRIMIEPPDAFVAADNRTFEKT